MFIYCGNRSVSKCYVILILFVIDIKLWNLLVTLMVSSHCCSCVVHCWIRSRIYMSKSDFIFKGAMCWFVGIYLGHANFQLVHAKVYTLRDNTAMQFSVACAHTCNASIDDCTYQANLPTERCVGLFVNFSTL